MRSSMKRRLFAFFGIFRHFCLAFVDICLTYRDSRWCIDTVVETIIIFEGEIFSGLFEEAVEGEEFCQIFLRYFTAEASKTEIIRLGISAINGVFTEFLKEFVEEGGLFTKVLHSRATIANTCVNDHPNPCRTMTGHG